MFSLQPEVIGTFLCLQELWLDGNQIKNIPSVSGHLLFLADFENE